MLAQILKNIRLAKLESLSLVLEYDFTFIMGVLKLKTCMELKDTITPRNAPLCRRGGF